MTGAMRAADVTADDYPELFALCDLLAAEGIASHPMPFDVYQGPYLDVPDAYAVVWYGDAGLFNIERGFRVGQPGVFDTQGADDTVAAYTVESAARRLAELAKA